MILPLSKSDVAEVLLHIDLALLVLSRIDFGEESPHDNEGEQHDVDADNDILKFFLQLDPADLPAPSRRHYKAAKMAANKTAKPALSALLIARL